MQDQAVEVRAGEELNLEQLTQYLLKHVPDFTHITAIRQFPGGFSNLTYLLHTNLGEWVLRRPPKGAKIKSAHDMGREYRVLEKLQPIYGRIPAPIHLCEDEEQLGYSFYTMERVKGIILRNKPPQGLDLSAGQMRVISEAAIDNLALLHQIDIDATSVRNIGKPEGYVERQVSGWIKRYRNAQTDDIQSMDEVAEWMQANQPADGPPGLIHNDYKYDNLVLDQEEPARILAVLDWEMATVGDTRMDLGTTLAYWTEPAEAKLMQLAAGNLTWLPGNLNREEVVERYQQTTGQELGSTLFYYVYGAFKIGVIVQQIYRRWKQGHSNDPRFGGLIQAVHYFGNLARFAIDKDRISNLVT
ncbi:MAG: phosphotransferase family protein [Bacteroidota bacterium]